MRKKVYWILLTVLVKQLCDYFHNHYNSLPTEVQYGTQTLKLAIDGACDFLIAYDKAHPRGRFYSES
jgi:hypothetical protein